MKINSTYLEMLLIRMLGPIWFGPKQIIFSMQFTTCMPSRNSSKRSLNSSILKSVKYLQSVLGNSRVKSKKFLDLVWNYSNSVWGHENFRIVSSQLALGSQHLKASFVCVVRPCATERRQAYGCAVHFPPKGVFLTNYFKVNLLPVSFSKVAVRKIIERILKSTYPHLPECSSIGTGVWLVDPANSVEFTKHFNALVFSAMKFTKDSDSG